MHGLKWPINSTRIIGSAAWPALWSVTVDPDPDAHGGGLGLGMVLESDEYGTAFVAELCSTLAGEPGVRLA